MVATDTSNDAMSDEIMRYFGGNLRNFVAGEIQREFLGEMNPYDTMLVHTGR